MYKCGICNKEFETSTAYGGHKGSHFRGPRKVQSYCINCNEIITTRHSSATKYCSHKCFRDYQYKNVTLKKIEEGLITRDKSKGNNGSSKTLKTYIINTHGNKCFICGIEQWLNNPITLDLDHIDGNHKNNISSNLRLICPNCHRQTITWGRKMRA